MIFEVGLYPTRSTLPDTPRIYLRKDRWDDYGHRVQYQAWLFTTDGTGLPLGDLKILQRGKKHTATETVFEQLDESYVSLAQSFDYYEILDQHGVRHEVLQALRDLTLEPQRRSEFFGDDIDRTLLRFPIASEILAERGRRRGTGRRLEAEIVVPGFEGPHHIDLSFGGQLDRVGVLVGANGSGKTRLLQVLGVAVAGLGPRRSESDTVRVDLRSAPFDAGVLAISYSAFDPFTPALRRANRLTKPYVHVGLRTRDNEVNLERAVSQALRAVSDISRSRGERWHELVEDAGRLAEDLPDGFDCSSSPPADLEVALERMAAGHQVLTMVLSALLAYCQPGRLVLIDEPETHLHPGLLSTFMRLLHEVLVEFDSYALVATHSPIPLQETPARMVRIIELEGRVPTLRPYPEECFGEDLGRILIHAFRQDPRERNYRRMIAAVYGRGGRRAVERCFPSGMTLGVRMILEALELDRHVEP